MMIPATAESAARRKFVVAWEPLFEILSEKMERQLRLRLSYRSGISGGIMSYENTGVLPVYEALDLADMIFERTKEEFSALLEGINAAFWGKK